MNFFESLQKSMIIAEIGVNHNGDVNLAKQMIVAAKKAGADAVKFQTFNAESLASRDTPLVKYQEKSVFKDETHFEMLERLELSDNDHYELANFCQNLEIEFLSTPYDIDSAKFLAQMNVRFFKTSSADIVDLPLQHFIATTGIPSIIATGMATLGEIEAVVRIYDQVCNSNFILLHCVSNYPCSDASLNLRAMQAIGKAFSVPYGFSDHSVGYLAAVASVTLGAMVIEKHFTLDRSLPGPDQMASCNPEEFSDLVRNIRRLEEMLGVPRKYCQPEEIEMATVSRKSLVIRRSVNAGQRFTEDDFSLKRPGTGITATYLHGVIGKVARVDLLPGHRLIWSDLQEPQP
jgi:N,N'-diacetyllegionaminate synthase